MGKKGKGNNYSVRISTPGEIAKAKATSVPVHFKNTLETANAIRGMTIQRALAYLKNVITRKECVPFRKFKGSVGKCGQAKQFGTSTGRWPQKSAKALIELLKNAMSNVEFYEKDSEEYYIDHIQVNQAPVTTRRTYRAHGRINPYVRHLCHIQLILSEKKEDK